MFFRAPPSTFFFVTSVILQSKPTKVGSRRSCGPRWRAPTAARQKRDDAPCEVRGQNEVVPTSPWTGKAAGRLAVAYVPPGRCSRAGSRVHVQDQEARLGRLAVALHLSGLCTHLALTLTLHQLGGSGSSILSPAGGLWAAGLSFIGLPGCGSGGQAVCGNRRSDELMNNVNARHSMSSNPCTYVRVRVSCA